MTVASKKLKKRTWAAIGTAAAVGGVAVRDLIQKKNAVLRNYPVLGHARYQLEKIRPMIQQYFIERDWDGRPFDKTTRDLVNARADGKKAEEAFGTLAEVNEVGFEWMVHSMNPLEPPQTPPRVEIGGPDCSQPYSMSLLNISAMSFGSLSGNAIKALNKGARMGNFAHDTGEGGFTPYHQQGGDLILEIGTGYFGVRDQDGKFDPERFRDVSSNEQIKAVEIKLSQGAKPGLGGVLPGPKVTKEIAEIRGIPEGVKCVSPPGHSAFKTPTELIEFIAKTRELSGGKPTGYKLCVTSVEDVLAMCKAMIEVGTAPDFIVVDGAEGGTGAAPVEFETHMGMPLTQGLMIVHNALVGAGLRDKVKIGASGKIAEGNAIVKRLIQGADFTNSARGMMLALGCIQSLRCAEGTCPVGVATQNPRLERGLDVDVKAERVYNFHQATVAQAVKIMASMGVTRVEDLSPAMLRRNVSPDNNDSFARLFTWLEPGELLSDSPRMWKEHWENASSSRYGLGNAKTARA